MFKLKFLLSVVVTLFVSFTLCSLTQAAPRTFVSGLGSDANPCSRTAPCRTFQVAHDAVDDKGEVLALDSAGYGVLTITKNVTISGEGVEATVNATTPINAIKIDTAGLKVVLRSLTVEGFGIGTNGIRANAVAAVNLTIQHCVIHGFTDAGLVFAINSGTGNLSLSDSRITDCGRFGVDLEGEGTGTVTATISNTRIENNGMDGLFINIAKATIRNSVISGNASNGIFIRASSEVNLESCETSNNVGDGIHTFNATSVVRVSRSVITDNGGYGFNNGGGGTFLSRVDVIQSQNSGGDVNNKIFSNTVEGNTAGNTNGTIGTYSSQ